MSLGAALAAPTTLAAAEVKLPSLNYQALAPMLILFGVAAVGVIIEAVIPARARHRVQLVLSLAGLVAALVFIVRGATIREVTAGGAIAIDAPALFLQG